MRPQYLVDVHDVINILVDMYDVINILLDVYGVINIPVYDVTDLTLSTVSWTILCSTLAFVLKVTTARGLLSGTTYLNTGGG